MLKEFKEFAFKGNLIDMAVGIIIGGAFATVVKSLVDDVIMPVVGLFTGGMNFSDKYAVLKGEVPDGTALTKAQEMDGVTLLSYGNFITALISFLILALVIFILIKKVVAAMQKADEEPEEDAGPSDEVVLLTEIRDALKGKSDAAS